MSQPIAPKTILLVEDEAIIAMYEAAALRKNGYKIVTAQNAEKAIESVQHHHIDLILIDIDLGKGKMDGTETAEIIQKEHDIPIVFLSSHTEPEIVEKTEGITSYVLPIRLQPDLLQFSREYWFIPILDPGKDVPHEMDFTPLPAAA